MEFFNTIIKRAANFSVQSYDSNKHNVIDFFNSNDLFRLSILISSNSLYEDIKKNKKDKIQISLAKYFTRAHFNPTPFGLFSSVGAAEWGTATELPKSKKIKLSVSHDNLFLSVKKNKEITSNWTSFTYSINPSLHFSAKNKIGFYNSKVKEGDKIEVNFVELDYDENIEWMLEKFRSRPDINSLFKELIEQDFEKEDVEDYLLQLIDTGFFIENFLFNPYCKKLEKNITPYLSDLIEKKFFYIGDKDDIRLFNEKYIAEQKLFFQESSHEQFSHSVNSFEIQSGHIDENFKLSVEKYIDFVLTYNFNTKPITARINEFTARVSERYNEGFIALNSLFNPFSGISYNDSNADYVLKLHQDIFCKVIASTGKELFLNLPVDDDIVEKRKKMPLTFNVIGEILKCRNTGSEIIFFRGLGGESALNLISRFSEVNQELCKEIINFEKEYNKDNILADINCVGNFRSINIAPKEQQYDYCIPINTSYAESKNPIFASDIYVKLEGGKIRLVSKEHKKEIRPKKCSAINPKISDSEVYKFLCDFEFYNEEIYGISFNFNSYACFRDFIPRVYMETNVLLSPAQLLLVNSNYTFEGFKTYFFEKILEFDFTKTVNFYYLKGNTIIDSSKDEELKIIYDNLKTNDYFYVSENIYENFYPAVEDSLGSYAHELIISVKNSNYQRHQFSDIGINIVGETVNNTPVISEWLYFEVHCNSYADNNILRNIYTELYLKQKFKDFFFVHYDNNGRVLRLRFKTDSIENKSYIVDFIDKMKQGSIIKKYYILPYEPEIFRYGGQELMSCAEFIFNLDSIDLIENVVMKELSSSDAFIVSIFKIINYLKLLNFSNDEMIDFCENSINKFSVEFEFTAEARKIFNDDYFKIRFKISDYKYHSFISDKSLKNKLAENLNLGTVSVNIYAGLIIHMSMNRHFNEKQRFNEFKAYYLTKKYLNQLKFKE